MAHRGQPTCCWYLDKVQVSTQAPSSRLQDDYDYARLVLERLEDGHNILELVDTFGKHGSGALLTDRQWLTDAEDGRQALLKDVGQLRSLGV